MCYYFDDIIRFEDFGFDNILIDEQSYKNWHFVQKFDWCEAMRIAFDKIDGFNRVL